MPSNQRPAVTIQKRGALALNPAAFEFLGLPKAVELFYDRQKRLIGIKKASLNNPDAYPVRNVGKSGASKAISAKAFLSYYNIPRDVARRWTVTKQREMLVLDLKAEGTVVSANDSRVHEGGG